MPAIAPVEMPVLSEGAEDGVVLTKDVVGVVDGDGASNKLDKSCTCGAEIEVTIAAGSTALGNSSRSAF